MKTISSIVLTGLIFVTAAISNATAQIANNSSNFSESNSNNRSEISKPASIAPRALKNFNSLYKNASDIKWHNAPDGGTIVDFTNNEIRMKSAYNKKGNWVHTLRYYGEHKLPMDVRHSVKSIYYDFTITQVIEILQPNQRIYLVQIEDGKSHKTLRICDGELEIVEDFKK